MTEKRWEVRLGDCVEGMRGLADGSVDSVVTDPPYEAEAHTKQRRVKRGNEPLSFEPLSEELRVAVAKEVARVAKRWVVLFCQVEAAMKWRDALVSAGLAYKRTGVWIKPDGMPQYTGDRPGMGYESIVCCHVKRRSRWNGGGRHGVWTFNKIGPADVNRTGHETQKPLALMECLIRDFTDADELVLDPFTGSGTTGVACIRNGRRFLGFEKSEKYFEMARKRIDGTREQGGLFAAEKTKSTQLSLEDRWVS